MMEHKLSTAARCSVNGIETNNKCVNAVDEFPIEYGTRLATRNSNYNDIDWLPKGLPKNVICWICLYILWENTLESSPLLLFPRFYYQNYAQCLLRPLFSMPWGKIDSRGHATQSGVFALICTKNESSSRSFTYTVFVADCEPPIGNRRKKKKAVCGWIKKRNTSL